MFVESAPHGRPSFTCKGPAERGEAGRTPAPSEGDEPTTQDDRALLCARCRHPITRASARISVDGTHEHEATNPHGYTWRFGCFSTAPGCASSGVPSKQHTWFAGHWWHVQVCGGCGALLGWLFFGEAPPGDGGGSFYGLILDHLVEEPKPN